MFKQWYCMYRFWGFRKWCIPSMHGLYWKILYKSEWFGGSQMFQFISGNLLWMVIFVGWFNHDFLGISLEFMGSTVGIFIMISWQSMGFLIWDLMGIHDDFMGISTMDFMGISTMKWMRTTSSACRGRPSAGSSPRDMRLHRLSWTVELPVD